MEENELGRYIVAKYDRLYTERDNWDNHWEDVAEYVLPRKDDVYGVKWEGERKVQRLYDSTSVQANELLASALHGMLTNPASVWFALSSGDTELDKDHNIRLWLQDTTMRMIEVLNSSNFQTQIHETYLDLGAIGTNVLFIDEHPTKTIYFDSNSIYGFVIEEDQFGRVDTVGWCRKRTYKQLVDEYGKDNLPDEVLNHQHHTTKEWEVIHFVEPNKEYDSKAPKVKTNLQFRSVHVIRRTHHVLKESGYHESPFAVPRWTKIAGEKYGRSPGMKSLPDTKMLNAMSKVRIRGAQKIVDPPLLVPDHGFALPLDTRPGGSIYFRSGTQDKIEPLVTNARPDLAEEFMESTRARIRQAFFIDQLQLVQGGNMTATEVMQRTEENLRLMGPILGRLNDELLRPIVDRLFGIMLRKGDLIETPKELRGRDLKVEYVSQIAKAQRASESDTLLRVIQASSPIIQVNPDIMDNFDGDAVLRHNAKIFGLPEEMLRDPADVSQMRQQRRDAEEDAIEAQLQNQEADTAQKLASAQQQQQLA